MDVVKIAADIAYSNSEQKLHRYILSFSDAPLSIQMHICYQCFQRFDSIVEPEPNSRLLPILLLIPIELSKFHCIGDSSLSNSNRKQLVDSIASHFLARSNGVHESLRLAIMLFFSQVPHQEKWKQQKILERFGENLLQSLFEIYTHDKERSVLALIFLKEHMEIFLSTSPELAAMTNAFFQSYMFKQPASFIEFMNEYKDYLLQKNQLADFFVVHCSFLIQQSLDFNHEITAFNLLKILAQYINAFDHSKQTRQFETMSKIIQCSKTLSGREIGLFIQKEFQTKQKINIKSLIKQFSTSVSANMTISSPTKRIKKTHEDMSLFKMFLLLG